MTRDDEATPVALPDLDDEALLTVLRDVYGRLDPPPAWLLEAARSTYALRTADAELARLATPELPTGRPGEDPRPDPGRLSRGRPG